MFSYTSKLCFNNLRLIPKLNNYNIGYTKNLDNFYSISNKNFFALNSYTFNNYFHETNNLNIELFSNLQLNEQNVNNINEKINVENNITAEFMNKRSKLAKRKRAKRKYGKKISLRYR